VDYDFLPEPDENVRPPDPRQAEALDYLREMFQQQRTRVFFSRQVEVLNEGRWFHWVTNRALNQLIEAEEIRAETRPLRTRGALHLMWHRSHRYHQRDANRVVRLVEEYADPNIGAALGLHGEAMILEGFARRQFVLHDRNSRAFRGRSWTESAHDLDFIFERDGVAYGVEVKNTLGYMEHEELQVKVHLCSHLGVRPVFAVRMLPKSWIKEIVDAKGFALILKYQLYPWTHRELARRVREELGLPVDSPRALQDGTMERFVRWHFGRHR
jgi:hypothetical protein